METDVEYMKRLLPNHYSCEPRKNGVHCYSDKGIADDKGKCDHWELIMLAIKKHFSNRFLEVFHQTNTYHKKFTVFFKEIRIMKKRKVIGVKELDNLISELNLKLVLESRVRQVRWLHNNGNKCLMVYEEKLVRIMIHRLEERVKEVQMQKLNYQKLYEEAKKKLIDNGIERPAIQTDLSRG